jgi:hypothetical protein
MELVFKIVIAFLILNATYNTTLFFLLSIKNKLENMYKIISGSWIVICLAAFIFFITSCSISSSCYECKIIEEYNDNGDYLGRRSIEEEVICGTKRDLKKFQDSYPDRFKFECEEF